MAITPLFSKLKRAWPDKTTYESHLLRMLITPLFLKLKRTWPDKAIHEHLLGMANQLEIWAEILRALAPLWAQMALYYGLLLVETTLRIWTVSYLSLSPESAEGAENAAVYWAASVVASRMAFHVRETYLRDLLGSGAEKRLFRSLLELYARLPGTVRGTCALQDYAGKAKRTAKGARRQMFSIFPEVVGLASSVYVIVQLVRDEPWAAASSVVCIAAAWLLRKKPGKVTAEAVARQRRRLRNATQREESETRLFADDPCRLDELMAAADERVAGYGESQSSQLTDPLELGILPMYLLIAYSHRDQPMRVATLAGFMSQLSGRLRMLYLIGHSALMSMKDMRECAEFWGRCACFLDSAEATDFPLCLHVRDINGEWMGDNLALGQEFTIRRGEHVLFTGPNGQGKTALTRSICCLAPGVTMNRNATAGTAVGDFSRRVVYHGDQSPFDRAHFGALFSPELAESDDFAHVAEATQFDRRWARDGTDTSMATLSAGQRARARLAHTLLRVLRPAGREKKTVVVLDEPETHIDADSVGTIVANIQEFCRERGVTLFVVSHSEKLAKLPYDVRVRLESGVVSAHAHREEGVWMCLRTART
jgi:ABC-type Mn2+/Zn2+ transport system ATPase subunit